jgi:hypothetical protein
MGNFTANFPTTLLEFGICLFVFHKNSPRKWTNGEFGLTENILQNGIQQTQNNL